MDPQSVTRRPIPLETAWLNYCRALMNYDRIEAIAESGGFGSAFAKHALPALQADLERWRDAWRAAKKREQECEGA